MNQVEPFSTLGYFVKDPDSTERGVGAGGGRQRETEREGKSDWLVARLLPGQLDCMHPSRVRRELVSQKKLEVLLLEMGKDAD